MKQILVTGGAGFIGSAFVRRIFESLEGTRVVVLDALTYAGNMQNLPERIRNDARFEFWYGNVNNGELVTSLVSRSDGVVHFAAESHVARSIFDNRLFYETDVLGTQTVANAVLKASDRVERLIHISTSEVYGTALSTPMDEEHALKPMSPYASAKAGADRLVYSYYATYRIPAVIIRPFNNYGPHQHLEKVVPRFVTSAILGEPLTVHGDGSASRDWVFVEDCVEGVERALLAPRDRVEGEVINLGTGRDHSVLDIANHIMTKMDVRTSKVAHVGDRPGQVNRHISSTDKARELLGWQARTSLEEGLARTVAWYRENRAWWEPLRFMRHVPVKMTDGRVEMH